MEFVEINANRKPKLSGGRRGSATLQPGGNAVSNNLVPVSQLPPSAGALGGVFNDLHHGAYTKGGKRGKKSPPPFFHETGGAMIANPDGTYSGVGSDDPNNWSRMPKKMGGAYLGADGKVHHGGHGMSSTRGGAFLGPDGKLHTVPRSHGLGSVRGGMVHHAKGYIPSHGHGAKTSIGTNYQLAQFGGGAMEPLGNLAPTLSPALSQGSVGAGRASSDKLPRGKANLMKVIKLMVDGRKQMRRGGSLSSAWKELKAIATGLYHEFGPQIYKELAPLLKEAVIKGAHHYIHGETKEGGDFWSDIWDGLKGVGAQLFSSLKDLLNSDFFKEIEHELLNQGLAIGKEQLGKWMMGGGRKSGGRRLSIDDWMPTLPPGVQKQVNDAAR